jgi:hypothetical protein
VTIPRPIALALAGLALTASLTACSSGPRQSSEQRYQEYQMEDEIAKYQVERIRQQEADTRRIVQDEIARQRPPAPRWP